MADTKKKRTYIRVQLREKKEKQVETIDSNYRICRVHFHEVQMQE